MIKTPASKWPCKISSGLRRKANIYFVAAACLLSACGGGTHKQDTDPAGRQSDASVDFPIKLSDNHRFFVDQAGHPFFWLGDTGWLLLSKLNEGQVTEYLDDRQRKGFNVIQVMVIHSLDEKNVYGRTALVDGDLSRPDTATARGSDTLSYWQGLDSAVAKTARRNMAIVLVPVWGSVGKSGKVTRRQATQFGNFLASRYHDAKNVIWFNGGDVLGSDSSAIWEALGHAIKSHNPHQLMSFHPRGRTQSSEWFQEASWLDFNCFQSGHRRYDQDTDTDSHQYGEDNYKYVQVDYQKTPVKPTLDAEPSYEGIPQGLHDSLELRWDAASIRRYGYWSVFAGAGGFTYGANAIMQFFDPSKGVAGAYGVRTGWKQALQDTAAGQMIYLKNLMLSRSYLTRVPDTAAVMDQGEKYDYVAATQGDGYAFFYTPNGRTFKIDLTRIHAADKKIRFSWFNPRNGQTTGQQTIDTGDTYQADPPGEKKHGNDWVLIVDKV